jgi:eukaryotic-like serine/threonine-protein kinase
METLAARIAREGALPEADAVGWVIRVSRSVERIHERLGEHGRLSADAILIESGACVSEGRLLDFVDLPVSVAYHSPERSRGEGPSSADDAWALAVMLYFALSGSLPFSGATVDEVRRKITSVPAPPLAVFDVGDDELQSIVDGALASNLADRIAGLADLRRRLEAWLPAGLAELPPLLDDDDLEEEATMIQMGVPGALRKAIADAAAKAMEKTEILPVTLGGPGLPQTPRIAPEGAPAAAPSLTSLVDDASLPEEPADPFAVPASRADVLSVSSRPPPSSVGSSSPPSSAKPEAPPPPSQVNSAPAAGGSRLGLVLACGAVLLGGGLAAFFWSDGAKSKTPPAGTGAPSVEAPASAPQAASASASAPPAIVTATALPVASASASAPPVSAAPPVDAAACVASVFPADSFGASPDFSFLCTERDPLKGAAAVRTQLVRAHRNDSGGAREWALLGWYEIAAFSMMRGHCCASPPPLEVPEVPRSCAPLPGVLAEIDAAIRSAADVSDERLGKAVDAYTRDAYCIVRTGMATRFGRIGNPQGGEDTAFKKFLARAVASKR